MATVKTTGWYTISGLGSFNSKNGYVGETSWYWGKYNGGVRSGYMGVGVVNGSSCNAVLVFYIQFPASLISSNITIDKIEVQMSQTVSSGISSGKNYATFACATGVEPDTPKAWNGSGRTNDPKIFAIDNTVTTQTAGTTWYPTYTYTVTNRSNLPAGSAGCYIQFSGGNYQVQSMSSFTMGASTYPKFRFTYTDSSTTTYNITYYRNTSTSDTTTYNGGYVTSGAGYSLIDCPWTRSGYSFNGWATSRSASSGSSAGTSIAASSVTKDQIWYATWVSSVSNKTITFKDVSGYNSSGTKTAYSNNTYFSFPSASDLQWARTGYTLKGWDTSSSGSTVVYSAGSSYQIAYSSLQSIYYAVWQANVTTKTIEFYSMLSLTSGTSPGTVTASSSSTSFTFPDESDFSPAWSIAGFTLVGWATTRANGGQDGTVAYYAGATYQISYSNLQDTYYAVWTPTQVTFTYKAGSYASNTADYFTLNYNYSSSAISLSDSYFDGGEKSNTKTTKYLTCNCNNGAFSNGATSYSTSDYNYYITTYVQTGWQLNNSVSSGTRYTTYAATTNKTFYPYWGSTSSGWEWSYIQFTVPSEEPTRSGYTFEEWNSNQNGTGTSYSSGDRIKQYASSGYSNVTLYAIWTANTYTINYLQGDATTRGTPTSQSATCNVSISLYTPTTLWKKNSTTANSTSYTTTYYLQGGKLDTWNGPNSYSSSGTNTTYGTYYTCSSTAYDTISYTHNGWAISSGGSKAYNFGGSYSQSTTTTKSFYPSWSTTTTHTYARRIMPTVSRVGYVLKGWSTSPSGDIMYTVGMTDSAADNSKTLYAIWEPEWTVKISNGTVWNNYHVWIYTGATSNGGWQQAIPYVYNGSTWKLTSI